MQGGCQVSVPTMAVCDGVCTFPSCVPCSTAPTLPAACKCVHLVCVRVCVRVCVTVSVSVCVQSLEMCRPVWSPAGHVFKISTYRPLCYRITSFFSACGPFVHI